MTAQADASDVAAAGAQGLTEPQKGVAFSIAAYGLWGVTVLVFKALEHVSPVEVIAERAFWSLPFAGLVLLAAGRLGGTWGALRDRRTLAILVVTALLVSLNWGIYVWAVGSGRTLDASFGYFINPLFNVLLGYVLLGERLRPAQTFAVLLAALAVALQTVMSGVFPWIGLVLAASFAVYGYLRKTVNVGATEGLLIEVALLAPLSLPIIAYFEASGTGHLISGGWDTALLLATGPATALPLMLFAAGARRVRLATTGLLQYIAPSITFLIAVFLFGEPLDGWKLASFVLIWIALAAYSVAALRAERGTAPAA